MTTSESQARKQNERNIRNAIQREMRAKLRDIVDNIFEESQRIVAERATDTGNLLRSGRVISKETSDGWPFFTINYNAPYASQVHDGREPGSMPPIDRLTEWVRRNVRNDSDVSDRAVAFQIARAIEENGIAPVPFLEEALNKEVRTG